MTGKKAKHLPFKRAASLLLALAVMFVFAACGGTPSSSQQSTASSGSTAAPSDSSATPTASGKTEMSVGIKAEINGSHPYDNGTPATAITGLICETLTDRAADGSVVPYLAESWKTEDDVTWLFDLKEGITFTNGEPMNAEAVAKTFEILSREEITWPLKGDITSVIASVEAVSEYQVKIVTHEPFGTLPLRLVLFRILPPGYFEEVGDEGYRSTPVGTGPYMHVEFEKGSHYVVEANPDYWGGEPQIKKITFNIILDSAARVAALESGDVDWILGVPQTEMERLAGNANLKVESYPTTFSMYGQFNTYKSVPLQDVRVRKAVNMSVDIDAIIEAVYAGGATKTNTMTFIPAFEGYDASIERDPYDPEAAKALLVEAGYGDGLILTMNINPASHPGVGEVAQIMAAQMAEIGITLEIQEIEGGLLRELYKTQDTADIVIQALGGWQGDGTVVANLALAPGSRYSVWKDPEFEEMRIKVETEVDPDLRAKLYTEMQQMEKDLCPGIVMWQTHENYAYSANLQDWVPYNTTNMVFQNSYFS